MLLVVLLLMLFLLLLLLLLLWLLLLLLLMVRLLLMLLLIVMLWHHWRRLWRLGRRGPAIAGGMVRIMGSQEWLVAGRAVILRGIYQVRDPGDILGLGSR